MKVHIAGPGDNGQEDPPTLCGRVVPRGATVGDVATCAVCLKAAKPKRKSVTASHPGVAEVAVALTTTRDGEATGVGLAEAESVVRDLVHARGCPKVPGGRGYRFVSVEAFRAWIDGFSLEERLQVKPWRIALKDELIGKISKLAWGMDEGERRRLRWLSYAQLQDKLAWWEATDARDKARGGRPIETIA